MNLKPIFFDGAFGTYYHIKTGSSKNCELANLENPNTVLEIHKEYLKAGVDCIKTNTFSVNSNLTNDDNLLTKLIEAGYRLAKEAAQEKKVFADIGPIWRDDGNEEEEYLNLVQSFLKCDATNFLFETLYEFTPILKAIECVRKSVEHPFILVSFAVSQDGYTKKGLYYKDLITAAAKYGINAVGINCICGPAHMYRLLQKMELPDNILVSAMPNSGYPMLINGRTEYQDNPEYFSEKLADICALGIPILGGCCGTTPEHIRRSIERIQIGHITEQNIAQHPHTVMKKKKSFVGLNKLKDPIIAVELDPPPTTDCNYLINASKMAKESGADLITIADSPLARTRADSFMLAAKVKREAGVEVMPHLCCRDRNHIAIKASLLGANIEQINHVLAITGDPISETERTGSKGVFNFNSFDLISYIHQLNQEVFCNSPYFICAALNTNASNFKKELERAEKKKQNGAQMFLTQPIYSQESIYHYKQAKQKLGCKILAGILPVASYKNALFLNNEVFGIEVPQEILSALKNKTPEETMKISIAYSISIIEQLGSSCDGYYIMTPLKKFELVCELVQNIRRRMV